MINLHVMHNNTIYKKNTVNTINGNDTKGYM